MPTTNPIPYVVDTLEKVPESLRDYYGETEEGGTFRSHAQLATARDRRWNHVWTTPAVQGVALA